MITPQHLALNNKINCIAGNTPMQDISDFAQAAKIIIAQVPLIDSEYEEFVQGIKNKSEHDVRDGLADIIVTCDGLLSRLGITMYTSAERQHTLTQGQNYYFVDSVKSLMRAISISVSNLKIDAQYAQKEKMNAYLRAHIVHHAVSAINAVTKLSALLGIDVMQDQQSVYESNLSKFDTDYDTALKGVTKYINMGVSVRFVPVTYDGVIYHVIKSKEDQVVNGKDYPKGKFLKSVLFKEPQWQPLANYALFENFMKSQHAA